ncbi:MAG: flagellar basal body L-ring protein FlgH [Rhodospirillaceae bacterium]|nr:flagellar basal body L-ring protein FlgH [Rhodospirillaceae bacterium]
MKRTMKNFACRAGCIAAAAALLAGCSTLDRLSRVGQEPELTPIENPVREANYEPITLPMPRAQPASYRPNSLWRTGAKAFFKDQRAAQIGDILTVNISINDEATLNNRTEQTRTNDEDNDISKLLGFEGAFDAILPEAVDPTDITDINSSKSTIGDGSVARDEVITLTVAAIVTQILPNGNFVIRGRQAIRVNFEVRELAITGVVRPEDISSTNTIDYNKMAEARVVYGGRGVLTDMQQPRYGVQLFDIIYPF